MSTKKEKKNKVLTNAEFAKEDGIFQKACSLASADGHGGKTPVSPTARQASKWRSQRGIAYSYRKKAAEALSGKSDG